MMRPVHLRMARAALGWSVRDLEAKSGVGRNTISRYEIGYDILASALDSLEKVMVAQGVVFFEGDGGVNGLTQQVVRRRNDYIPTID